MTEAAGRAGGGEEKYGLQKKAHVSELSVCWLTENSDWSESRF